MNNHRGKIKMVFFVLAVVGIAVGLSPEHVRAVPARNVCPCHFDLDFWTTNQWVLTENGLFDRCLLEPFAVTQLTGEATSNSEVTCVSNLTTQLLPLPDLPPQFCKATIRCFGSEQLGVEIYDQLKEITLAQHVQCSQEIQAIATAVKINCAGGSCIGGDEFFMSDCPGEDQLDLCEPLFCGFIDTTVDPPIAADFFLGGRGEGRCEPVDCNSCVIRGGLIDLSSIGSFTITFQGVTFSLSCF